MLEMALKRVTLELVGMSERLVFLLTDKKGIMHKITE